MAHIATQSSERAQIGGKMDQNLVEKIQKVADLAGHQATVEEFQQAATALIHDLAEGLKAMNQLAHAQAAWMQTTQHKPTWN